MSYSKADVTFHSDGFRDRRPAVNVKIHTMWFDLRCAGYSPNDPGFTLDWVNEHVSNDDQAEWFWIACGDGVERLQDDAHQIFGPNVKVFTEGRSGGWLVVEGLSDFDYWDAVDLAKWRKFERWAKEQAADVPYVMLELIELNVFEPWRIERDSNAALDAAALLPIQTTE